MSIWVAVVEAPLADARQAFLQWLSSVALSEEELDMEAVRVDTIRSVGGDVRKYSIRADFAESLGIDGPGS